MAEVSRIVIDFRLYPCISDAFADAARVMETLLNNGYICVFKKDEDYLAIEFELYDPDGEYGVPNPYWMWDGDIKDLENRYFPF